MAITNSSLFSLVFLANTTIVLLLAGQCTATTVTTGDLCDAVDYKPLCKATIKGMTEPSAALESSIKHAIMKTKHALSLTKMMDDSENNEICIETYEDAISDLKESMKNVKDHDKGTLNSNLSAAISYYSSCEDAYAETGEKSPLTGVNLILERMVDNCLALATLIHKF